MSTRIHPKHVLENSPKEISNQNCSVSAPFQSPSWFRLKYWSWNKYLNSCSSISVLFISGFCKMLIFWKGGNRKNYKLQVCILLSTLQTIAAYLDVLKVQAVEEFWIEGHIKQKYLVLRNFPSTYLKCFLIHTPLCSKPNQLRSIFRYVD